MIDPAEELLSVVVYGAPVPKARARIVGTGLGAHSYTPPRTRDAQRQVGWWLKMMWRRPPDEQSRFEVDMAFYLRSEKTRGDTDNFAKLVLDAGNQVVWGDDHQVVRHSATRMVDSRSPRTEIFIRRRR